MTRWLILAIIEAAALLAGIYFEPTHRVRGRLWGEAFFDDRPTSWWRAELERWDVKRHVIHRRHHLEWCGSVPPIRVLLYTRQQSWFEEHFDRWFPEDLSDEQQLERNKIRFEGPRLLHGDAAAIPVLQSLLEDADPKIRLFAEIGLKMQPEIPTEED